MADKINIIVERDGEFHKFKFGEFNCSRCSLTSLPNNDYDGCDVCLSLKDGHFEKMVTK